MALVLPGTRPMLFETLAITGGKPNASRVGNVISDPEPTTALIAPAATAASRIATISPMLTREPECAVQRAGRARAVQRGPDRSTTSGMPKQRESQSWV